MATGTNAMNSIHTVDLSPLVTQIQWSTVPNPRHDKTDSSESHRNEKKDLSIFFSLSHLEIARKNLPSRTHSHFLAQVIGNGYQRERPRGRVRQSARGDTSSPCFTKKAS